MTINIAFKVEPSPGSGARSMIAINEEGTVVYSRAQSLGSQSYTTNELAS